MSQLERLLAANAVSSEPFPVARERPNLSRSRAGRAPTAIRKSLERLLAANAGTSGLFPVARGTRSNGDP
jgi:hypothetical protein